MFSTGLADVTEAGGGERGNGRALRAGMCLFCLLTHHSFWNSVRHTVDAK